VSSGASAPPLRLGILGAGLSGLTLAHQLQRKLREQGRHNVEIHLHERTGRSGGWVRTQASSGFLLERGPRAMMFRADDAASAAALELVAQLGLGAQVVVADKAAARRFLWNGGEQGQMVAMPTGLGSLLRFPHSRALIKGFLHEWRAPTLPADADEAQMDESVQAWATRRLNR
jgi:protoporphyrinogen oxidase